MSRMSLGMVKILNKNQISTITTEQQMNVSTFRSLKSPHKCAFINQYSLCKGECRGQAIGMPSISSIHPIRAAKEERREGGRVGNFKDGR